MALQIELHPFALGPDHIEFIDFFDCPEEFLHHEFVLSVVFQSYLSYLVTVFNRGMNVDNPMQEICRADRLASQEVFDEIRIQIGQAHSVKCHYLIKLYIHFVYCFFCLI